MTENAIVNSVRQFLSSHHMFVDNDWITGCVEYLIEDGANSSDINTRAREQWLLNDLKDISPGSLPRSLRDQPKTTLNGRYVLQINAAVDIGTPAYQQYLKLQKVNMENVDATTKFEDKVPSHRMIKLYLTDGVQEITGVEYKPMRNLSCDLTPGSKVLIKGPLECRRGMLLLTEAAVELLGGEVQEIAATNSLSGLLATKLGLPPVSPESNLNVVVTQRPPNLPTPHMPGPPLPEQPGRPVARVTSLQLAPTFDEDIDVDQLAAIEAEFTEPPAKRPSTDVASNALKKPKLDVVPPDNKVDDYPDHCDLLFDEDEDYLRELEAKIEARESTAEHKGPVTLSADPFVYIKQINELTAGERSGRVFKVKGQIMRLLSKLSVGKDGWSLRCTIVDGTGGLDVEFTSEVLSKLVGYSPQEMNQIKKQMAAQPYLKEKAVSALQKAKDTLQVLYCIIEVTMLDVPKITRLTPFDGSHAEALRKRTHNL